MRRYLFGIISALAALGGLPGAGPLTITTRAQDERIAILEKKTIEIQKALDQLTEVSAKANNDLRLVSLVCPPIGTVMAYAGIIPDDPVKRGDWEKRTGWMLCDGRIVSTNDYRELYLSIGSTYGKDASAFKLPDLRGRAVAGKDDMGGIAAGRLTNSGIGNPNLAGTALGATGGVDRLTLSDAQLAPHAHGPGTYSIKGGPYSNGYYACKIETWRKGQAPDRGIFNFSNLSSMEVLLSNDPDNPAKTTATIAENPHDHPPKEWSGSSETNTPSGEAFPVVQPTIILNYIIRYRSAL